MSPFDPDTIPSAGGSSPVSMLGPYTKTFSDYNTAAGQPIALSPALDVGQIVEPFAFFPAFFNNGNPNNEILLGVAKTGSESLGSGESIIFDSNAPDNEGSFWGVSGLYNQLGVFPRRALYRIKSAGVALTTVGPGSGFTVGSIVIWAFVWTPE